MCIAESCSQSGKCETRAAVAAAKDASHLVTTLASPGLERRSGSFIEESNAPQPRHARVDDRQG